MSVLKKESSSSSSSFVISFSFSQSPLQKKKKEIFLFFVFWTHFFKTPLSFFFFLAKFLCEKTELQKTPEREFYSRKDCIRLATTLFYDDDDDDDDDDEEEEEDSRVNDDDERRAVTDDHHQKSTRKESHHRQRLASQRFRADSFRVFGRESVVRAETKQHRHDTKRRRQCRRDVVVVRVREAFGKGVVRGMRREEEQRKKR